MKCAQRLVRTILTPPALASSLCPCRTLNWVRISRLSHWICVSAFTATDFLLDCLSPTVHFNAYCPSFIGQYCRVSALLELESLMSQQALREAFSEDELLAAKKKHQQVQEHVQVGQISL